MLDELLFRLAIYEKHASEFQHFFSDIMRCYDSDFRSINPAGGDGGNDGYIPTKQHYFQVYAPSAADLLGKIPVINYKKASEKLQEDFEKLLKNWKEIKEYTFVMNDRFEGQSQYFGKALLELKESHQTIQFNFYGAHELKTIFNKLELEDKQSILRYPLSDSYSIKQFDSQAIGSIIDYILESCDKTTTSYSNNPIAPTFSKKLIFNNLSEQHHYDLKFHSYHIGYVDEFLKTNSNHASSIATYLKNLYEELEQKIPESDKNKSDIIYLGLYTRIIPEEFKINKAAYSGYIDAAKILVAKYFESCDVFKEPPEETD